MKTLASHINTDGKGEPVLVFNPLAWERGGVAEVTVQMPHGIDAISLEDEHGNVIPSQILSSDLPTHTFHLLFKLGSVPSMGYTVLRAVEGQHEFHTDLTSAGYTLENSALRITVDPKTGCITSLFDKRGAFEAARPQLLRQRTPGLRRQPQKLRRLEHRSRHTRRRSNAAARSRRSKDDRDRPTALRTSHHPHLEEIEVRAGPDPLRRLQRTRRPQQLRLARTAHPAQGCLSTRRQQANRRPTKFPTARSSARPLATTASRRHASKSPLCAGPTKAMARHGLSLLNSSKYGYDAVGNVLRLSLLRGATWPDPVADQGTQIFDYAIYPHSGHLAGSQHDGARMGVQLQAPRNAGAFT